jgi:hypothetical protein
MNGSTSPARASPVGRLEDACGGYNAANVVPNGRSRLARQLWKTALGKGTVRTPFLNEAPTLSSSIWFRAYAQPGANEEAACRLLWCVPQFASIVRDARGGASSAPRDTDWSLLHMLG